MATVHVDEAAIDRVVAVLRSGQLRQGRLVSEFEERFAEKVGAKFAVAVSSGTAALHVAYLALFREGDEVLVPDFTFIATASMLVFAGARPVFADIDPATYTLDVGDLERRIEPKTRGIAPVHLYGQVCDVEGLGRVARRNGLRVVWDAAQACGARYDGAKIGGLGDAVCYSFYPTKTITTGEGGMVTTDDPETYRRLQLLRSHGAAGKYEHVLLGLNYRMTDADAAIGISQLEELDALVEARRRNAAYLSAQLKDVTQIRVPFVPDYSVHAFNQYTIALRLERLSCSRDQFSESLLRAGVESAVHYPRGLQAQPALKAYAGAPLANSVAASRQVLSLPVHPGLTRDDLDRVVAAVRDVSATFAA